MDPDFTADAPPAAATSSKPSSKPASKTGSKAGSASALPPLPATTEPSDAQQQQQSAQSQPQPPAQPAPASKASSRRASNSQLAKPASPSPSPSPAPASGSAQRQQEQGQDRPGSAGLPEDTELALARAFLQESSDASGLNLYDHLSSVILRILEQRPKNAADIFEQLSGEVKRSRFPADESNTPGAFRQAKDLSEAVELAKAQIKAVQDAGQNRTTDGQPKEEEGVGEIPDMLDLVNLFEWAGVAPLSAPETYILSLSLRHLTTTKSLKSVRLFGKIFTLASNPYIVAECEPANPPPELEPGAVPQDDSNDPIAGFAVDAEIAKEKKEREELVAKMFEEAVEGVPEEMGKSIPKPKKGGFGEVKAERGVGVNKYVYYVCRFAGGPWIRLPDALPEKIHTSRKVLKYFSGDLNKKLVTYPAIECSEAQYLRCQIARIAASTVLSPQGYYMFDPEEEAALEEGGQPTSIIVNPEYRPAPAAELLQTSAWVHHVPYILPQGRVNWEAPPKIGGKEPAEGEEGEGEEKEEEEGGSEAGDGGSGVGGRESGPGVLTPVAEEAELAPGVPAFTIRVCSTYHTLKYTPIHLCSNRWPGAHTVAYQDRFANVYVGDGIKMVTDAHGYHIPEPVPDCAMEWVDKDKKEEDEQPEEKEEDEGEGGEKKVKENLGVLVEQVEPTLEQEKALEEEKAAKEAEKEEAEAEGKEDDE
ncbi:hypothetical protein M427DRAFT_65972 [Gonapodya prolifera JEL478]|uniref:Radial spokehead-like protein n=1 Tax=Gonapodya prolifera (strain JEL478) TaxID=1344416 RepID=A0A139AWU7_GONPJ|nr:hypothetical protein M427DRAFT_65972 [Gonapodya prolifera JEL478]|eukprot:KXS21200.1 hypothetical protein M427DRAFT_65972 [Gonapodya prolifera JEL478]